MKQYTDTLKEYLRFFWNEIANFHKVKIFLSRGLTENLTLKLISVMITLTLFALIAGESVQVSKTVKIEYTTPPDLMIVNAVPFEFEMVLSGSKSAIGLLQARDFLYKVDLSQALAGTSHVRINPQHLGLDRGVIVSSLMPSVVYPKLDKVVTKVVPIILSEKGEIKNMNIRKITLEPDQITITGPESFINQVFYIFTESFDLGKITKSGKYDSKLTMPNDKVSLTKASDEAIKVKIEANQLTIKQK